MKNLYVFILFAAVSALSSCSEFLDKKPLDAISGSDYWKTPTDLEMYVNQYYTVFPNETRNDYTLLEGNSDNLVLSSFNATLAGTRVVPASGGSWSSAWTQIRSVNYFLENYKTVNGAKNLWEHYVGEAYFFRAYFYFGLLRDFGAVPWINKPLKDDDAGLYTARDPRNVVADSIIADLDRAIGMMKGKDTATPFRLNRQIAQLFKSRVCLFEGTWEKYHAGTTFGVSGSDGKKYLELAKEAAGQLIAGDLYRIHIGSDPKTNYYYFFGQKDYSANPEVLLWKKWDNSLGLVRWAPSIWGNDMGITGELVNSYLCTDGLPIAKSKLYEGDGTLARVVKNRDPRLAQSIWVPGDAVNILGSGDTTKFVRADIHQTGSYRCVTGYQLKKYSNAWGDNLKANYYQSEIGSIIFRYAEALLNFAEAKAELGELTQADVDVTINKLRDRVGMPHLVLTNITPDPNWTYPALSPVINEVRRERRVELAFEGLRLYDLMRWRAHESITGKRPAGAKFVQADYPEMVVGTHVFVDQKGYIDAYQKALPNGYGFKPGRDYLNPIPGVELTLNDQYTQNPDWE